MHAKDLVKLNNEKRELLNEENRRDYLDMLSYIRLNLRSSEQQTEEVLNELLDHLLEAQAHDKTAKDVFGDDLKAYCKELIHELPSENKSNRALFFLYLGLHLFGIVGIFISIINMILYQIGGIGTGAFTFSIGTGIVALIINILLLAAFVYIVLQWIGGFLFKKRPTKKWLEFLQIWLICTVYIGSSLAVFYFMPTFGEEVSIPFFIVGVVGLLFYVAAVLLNRKYRITK